MERPQVNHFTPGLLAQMDHASLYQQRAKAPKEMQGLLSNYEHRAFAREAVAENPLMALPIAAGVPAWQLYKLLVSPGRSGASLDQMGQGFLGIGEGLSKGLLGK
jgi:hypothetical protein